MSELTDIIRDALLDVVDAELVLEEDRPEGLSSDDGAEVLQLVYDAHNALQEALDILKKND